MPGRCSASRRTAIPSDSPVFEQVTRPYRECPSDSAVQRAQYADLKIYLPNGPLVKVDRMSMAHSLEIRCPLLDHHLVELAFAHPDRDEARRRAAQVAAAGISRAAPAGRSGSSPEDAASRRQWEPGWLVPTPANSAKMSSVPTRRPGTSSIAHASRQLFSEHQAGHDHSYALWAVWMLERWARQEKVAS